MENSTKIPKEQRSKVQPDLLNNFEDEKMEESSNEKEETKLQSPNIEKRDREDTVEGLKNQLETLMNSLAVLSAEKSRMEANFQTEKRQIRSEHEEYEKVVKTLKDKMKRLQTHATSEVEHFKYKLIMERHEREKDQTEHAMAIRELQKIIRNEQKARDQLESQVKELKGSVSSKTQNKILEAELEALKNKLKQAEAAANETPQILLNLQSEMASMKKKHRNAIHEEQKRAAAAEQEAKTLAASHEARVVGLEARLAELSDIVGNYDRLRQQDQRAIHKLKDQLTALENNKVSSSSESPQQLVEKIKHLYFQLLELDKSNSSANVKDLLNNLKLCDKSQDTYKEKYETICKEYEELKKSTVANNVNHQANENVSSNEETQSHKEKSHNKNLEEKLRMLVNEMTKKERDFKAKLEMQDQLMQEQYLKTQQLLAQKDSECLNKIAALEQQLLKQRERSLSVIQEKDKEIQMLKSSFDALVLKKNALDSSGQKLNLPSKQNSSKAEAGDLMSGLLTVENNPPMIYYTQELARKEVQISSLRKQNVQLEAALRELERNSFRVAEKHEEEIKKLDTEIERLEASKSREGANLEYLKNVFLNFLTSSDTARKRHMLNAISTVLRFTAEENEKVAKRK